MADTALEAELKKSLVLDKGSGMPSFTRASVATSFDNEGTLLTIPPGAARFVGARMTYNQYKPPSGPANGTGTRINRVTLVTDTAADSEGGNNASTWTLDTIPGAKYVSIQTSNFVGIPVAYSIRVRRNSYRYLTLICRYFTQYDLVTDAWTSPLGNLISRTANIIDANWIEFEVKAIGTTNSVYGLGFPSSTGAENWTPTGTEPPITLYGAQVAQVSSLPFVNILEYVSVGHLSAPYHGAGIDGVKWFDVKRDDVMIDDATLHGVLIEGQTTNSLLHSGDLTQAAWVKTGCNVFRDQIGLDTTPNKASRMVATAPNATCFQTFTMASAPRSFSVFLKRLVGSGTIEITRDGGTTYTDVTSEVGSSYVRVSIENSSVTNPTCGIRLGTSGDEVAVGIAMDEDNAFITTPIKTDGTAVTREADVLTYQTTGNITDTQGAILAEVSACDWLAANGGIGSATTGLHITPSFSGVQAKDGTSTANGAVGTPVGTMQLGMNWGSGSMRAVSNGTLGDASAYDGSLNLTNILVGVKGGTRKLRIYTDEVSDVELITLTGGIAFGGSIWNNDTAMAFFRANGYPTQYNDGMRAWLKDFYNLTDEGYSLQDLLARYIRENGHQFPV